uniref:CUB domain-containing protein n=1 Tax=Strigamia maritima TaxID=126957 RepID=T1IRS6_STRMM
MTRCRRTLNSLVLFLTLSTVCAVKPPFTQCGGPVNGTRGYMLTPNFPSAFPVPIRCRWIIEAPAGKAISVYFTQFYLREGLRATEYLDFVDDNHYLGKKNFGVISFDNRTTYMMTAKPVLILDLAIEDMNNINMRVMDHFLDVYGFNITYEIIDNKAGVRRDACSIFHCSFNGHCFASAGFLKYSCHCLPGFWGDECQYGLHCDPWKNVTLCERGHQCRFVVFFFNLFTVLSTIGDGILFFRFRVVD